MLNVRLKDDAEYGHICEIQIVHRQMLVARQGLGGHAIYNCVRNASELLEHIGQPQPCSADPAGALNKSRYARDCDDVISFVVTGVCSIMRDIFPHLRTSFGPVLSRPVEAQEHIPLPSQDAEATADRCSVVLGDGDKWETSDVMPLWLLDDSDCSFAQGAGEFCPHQSTSAQQDGIFYPTWNGVEDGTPVQQSIVQAYQSVRIAFQGSHPDLDWSRLCRWRPGEQEAHVESNYASSPTTGLSGHGLSAVDVIPSQLTTAIRTVEENSAEMLQKQSWDRHSARLLCDYVLTGQTADDLSTLRQKRVGPDSAQTVSMLDGLLDVASTGEAPSFEALRRAVQDAAGVIQSQSNPKQVTDA